MPSKYIQQLANLFGSFPTVGRRTAQRFVYHLIHLPKKDTKELLKAIIELKEKIKICSFCFSPFDNDGELCDICNNPSRDQKTLCVVEKESDQEAIEKTGIYKGRYFILGGTLSPVRKDSIKKIRIKELKERLDGIEEVIIATNFTVNGEATALFLERNLDIKTTRLGRGLPVGGELEYADEETLSAALESRRSL
jgi:recombination protein RecR